MDAPKRPPSRLAPKIAGGLVLVAAAAVVLVEWRRGSFGLPVIGEASYDPRWREIAEIVGAPGARVQRLVARAGESPADASPKARLRDLFEKAYAPRWKASLGRDLTLDERTDLPLYFRGLVDGALAARPKPAATAPWVYQPGAPAVSHEDLLDVARRTLSFARGRGPAIAYLACGQVEEGDEKAIDAISAGTAGIAAQMLFGLEPKPEPLVRVPPPAQVTALIRSYVPEKDAPDPRALAHAKALVREALRRYAASPLEDRVRKETFFP